MLSPVSLLPWSVTWRQSLLFLQPPSDFSTPIFLLSHQHRSLVSFLHICCSQLSLAVQSIHLRLAPVLPSFVPSAQHSSKLYLHFYLPFPLSSRIVLPHLYISIHQDDRYPFPGTFSQFFGPTLVEVLPPKAILQPAGTESPSGQFVLSIVNGNPTQNARFNRISSHGDRLAANAD